MTKVFSFLFLLFSGIAYSQVSVSASIEARVTVVEPIQIRKSYDLNFGNVISGNTPGTLMLKPDGTRIASGVEISNAVPGEVNPAEAIVLHGNHNYSINFPISYTLYNVQDPSQRIIVDDFTVKPFSLNPETGSDILMIGATLNMKAHQGSGYYTNPIGFNVTVAYN